MFTRYRAKTPLVKAVYYDGGRPDTIILSLMEEMESLVAESITIDDRKRITARFSDYEVVIGPEDWAVIHENRLESVDSETFAVTYERNN